MKITKLPTTKPLTREVVVDLISPLLSMWWVIGYRKLNYNYTQLFQCVFPHHKFGQAHARFIGIACRFFEEKHGVEIKELLPNLISDKWHSTLKSN